MRFEARLYREDYPALMMQAFAWASPLRGPFQAITPLVPTCARTVCRQRRNPLATKLNVVCRALGAALGQRTRAL